MSNRLDKIRNNIACHGANFIFNHFATSSYKHNVNVVVNKGCQKLNEELAEGQGFSSFNDFMNQTLRLFPNASISEYDGEIHLSTGYQQNHDGTITPIVDDG